MTALQSARIKEIRMKKRLLKMKKCDSMFHMVTLAVLLVLLIFVHHNFVCASSVKYMKVGSRYKIQDKNGIVQVKLNNEVRYKSVLNPTKCAWINLTQNKKYVIVYTNKKRKTKKIVIYADGKQPAIMKEKVNIGYKITVKDDCKLDRIYLDGKKVRKIFYIKTSGEHIVRAFDKAGNQKKIKVKLKDGLGSTAAVVNSPIVKSATTINTNYTQNTVAPSTTSNVTFTSIPQVSAVSVGTPISVPSATPVESKTSMPSATPVCQVQHQWKARPVRQVLRRW